MDLYKLKIMNKIVLPGKCLHVACHYRCVCVLSEKKKENDFPSDECSEVEGKDKIINWWTPTVLDLVS